ncbi:SDR family oxidoreductase [Chitinophaga polysaccharea]|uniref:SDR family oxidoreductase n=1 Tax=Chitinophaga TaxID=79328 RepID=UPI0014558A1A|nr:MULTISPECIES: SDR family oxidoreductase [Chitinophaga]NLR61037.1 SDR family oxidoreductase [Chitinophaga polysaccharea]NLU96246.1 SDR family oxidoreductase [Chitinophaga sp. Ak27]
MDLSLKGKTALVCGSTQGIGLAIAVELALLGATCILLARNEDRLKTVLPTLATGEGQQHRFEVADFSDIAQVTAVAAKIAASGPVHILINNTGGPAGGPVIEADTTAFTAAFSQHLLCNQVLAQALVPGMIQARFGRIINIISTSVKTPIKNLGVSNTTRWAVAAWSKTLATELAPHGITVNNVLPGSTSTARLEGLFNSSAAARNVSREAVEAEWLKEIPMQRFGEAREIAALAAFLASPAAGYITGTSTAVDGGKTPVM